MFFCWFWERVYEHDIKKIVDRYNLTSDWSYYDNRIFHSEFYDKIIVFELKYDNKKTNEHFYERFIVINDKAFSKNDFIALDENDLYRNACKTIQHTSVEFLKKLLGKRYNSRSLYDCSH